MPGRFVPMPNETARAFAAFRIYLDQGRDRSLQRVGDTMGITKRQVEVWSKRFGWMERVRGIELALANLEQAARERLAVGKAVVWEQRHEVIRLAEWERHKMLLTLADLVIDRWRRNPNKAGTLEGIARVIELASKLARAASGMALEPLMEPAPAVHFEVNVALDKVYGQPRPGEVVVEVKP